jgi:hypothetical protein
VKREIKEQANLIQLTFSALNKSGLVFACFLIGGLILAGVSFWRTLQENRPTTYSNIVEDGEPPYPLGSLSARKTLAESSYDISRDITFKKNRYNIILDMLSREYSVSPDLLQSDSQAFQIIKTVQINKAWERSVAKRKVSALRVGGRNDAEVNRESLKPVASFEEIRKDLELNEYEEDYKYLRKKDSDFENSFESK